MIYSKNSIYFSFCFNYSSLFLCSHSVEGHQFCPQFPGDSVLITQDMINCLVGSGFSKVGPNISFVYGAIWVPSWILDRQTFRGQAAFIGFLNYLTVLPDDITKYPANSHNSNIARAPKFKFLHSFKFALPWV